jgi:hypothetical protein
MSSPADTYKYKHIFNICDIIFPEYYTKIKDKIEALKAQISFRKNVLLQQADTKETFNFSKKKPQ